MSLPYLTSIPPAYTPSKPSLQISSPANGKMTVEMAMNRAQTSHSYNGVNAGTFPDGKEHPGLGYTDDGKKAHDS